MEKYKSFSHTSSIAHCFNLLGSEAVLVLLDVFLTLLKRWLSVGKTEGESKGCGTDLNRGTVTARPHVTSHCS